VNLVSLAMRIFWLLVTSFFLLSSAYLNVTVNTGLYKRALRKLADGDYPKTEALLQKIYEDNPQDPGALYINSLLYTQAQYPAYQIDTAYQYINQATQHWPDSTNPNALKDLNKADIFLATLQAQKARIDSLAFERALATNTIAAYQDFLNRFMAAAQSQRATQLLYQRAYEAALQSNTYGAYRKFIGTYGAAPQVPKATALYDSALFYTLTASQTLESYQQFWRNYPTSPYRQQLLPQLYALGCLPHTERAYQDFINLRPGGAYRQKALNQWYHLLLSTRGYAAAGQWLSGLQNMDSLQRVHALNGGLWLPLFKTPLDGALTYYNEAGQVVFNRKFNIDQAPCQPITKALLAGTPQGPGLTARNGLPVFKGPIDEWEDLGHGLLKLYYAGRYGLVRTNGQVLLPLNYLDIVLLEGKLIAYESLDGWRLMAHNGTPIGKGAYSWVDMYGEVLVLEQNQRFALTTFKEVVQALQQNQVPALDFVYNDVQKTAEGPFLVSQGQQQAMLGANLRPQSALQAQRYTRLSHAWLVEKNGAQSLVNPSLNKVLASNLTETRQRLDWITFKDANGYALWHKSSPTVPTIRYEQVNILRNDLALAYKNNDTLAVFAGGTKLQKLSAFNSYKVLQPAKGLPNEVYLQLNTGNGGLVILNKDSLLFGGRYNNLQALGGGLFSIEKRGRKVLLGQDGKPVLPNNKTFVGTGSYNQGWVPLLDRDKFGVYHVATQTYVAPKYNRLPVVLNNLWAVFKNKEQYILYRADYGNAAEQKVAQNYEMLNDSLVVLQYGANMYEMLNINSLKSPLSSFSDYEVVNLPGGGKALKVAFGLPNYGQSWGFYHPAKGLVIDNEQGINEALYVLGSWPNVYFIGLSITNETEQDTDYVVSFFNQQGKLISKGTARQNNAGLTWQDGSRMPLWPCFDLDE